MLIHHLVEAHSLQEFFVLLGYHILIALVDVANSMEVCEDHRLDLRKLILQRGGQHIETLLELAKSIEVSDYAGVDHIKLVVHLQPEGVTAGKLAETLKQLNSSSSKKVR